MFVYAISAFNGQPYDDGVTFDIMHFDSLNKAEITLSEFLQVTDELIEIAKYSQGPIYNRLSGKVVQGLSSKATQEFARRVLEKTNLEKASFEIISYEVWS